MLAAVAEDYMLVVLGLVMVVKVAEVQVHI